MSVSWQRAFIPLILVMVTQYISWKKITVEAATIVGSILLAFVIDAWWDDHSPPRSQSFNTPSAPPETIMSPSGEKATSFTRPV